MIETITFDFWNTLYKPPTKEIVDNTISNMYILLREANYEVSQAGVKDAFWRAWQKAYEGQRESGLEIGPLGQVQELLKILDINLDEPLFAKFYRAFTDTLLDYPPPLNDHVAETLPVLSKRFKLAVICNTGITPGKGLRKLMAEDDILKYFTVLTFSDELGVAKPKKTIFNHTLNLLKSPSNEAAHIGDDATTDIWGAKNAGMTTIWLAPHVEYAVVEADFHIRSVKALLTLF